MATKKSKILFLDILTDKPVVRNKIEKFIYNGKTYGEEIRKILGLKKSEFDCIDASKNVFPNLNNYNGIIIGGSTEDPISGTEKKWVLKTYDFIKLAISVSIPMLGICGGLQFVVRALGGEVIYNPKGRTFGNSVIHLTKKGLLDKLFKDLPETFKVYSSHKCIVKNLKKDWSCLGFSEKTPFEVIAIGDNIRLVQFHPEMTTNAIKSLSLLRKDSLIKEGYLKEGGFDEFLRALNSDENVNKKILNNFIVNFSKK